MSPVVGDGRKDGRARKQPTYWCEGCSKNFGSERNYSVHRARGRACNLIRSPESSTAQGKRKCTGGGATSSRTTPRTSGWSNQVVNTVPRSRDYIYSTVKTTSRSNSRDKASSTRTAKEQTSSSTEDVGTPPTTRTFSCPLPPKPAGFGE